MMIFEEERGDEHDLRLRCSKGSGDHGVLSLYTAMYLDVVDNFLFAFVLLAEYGRCSNAKQVFDKPFSYPNANPYNVRLMQTRKWQLLSSRHDAHRRKRGIASRRRSERPTRPLTAIPPGGRTSALEEQ